MSVNQPMSINIPSAIAIIAPDGSLTARQKRHLLIQMALRRVRPGTGSAPVFMRERTAMLTWPDLREILKDFDWLVVGGVATRAYMPERLTKDLDILVRRRDGDAVIAQLKKSGFETETPLAIPGCLLRSADGVDVDVLFGEAAWLDEALAHPDRDPAGFPVATLPYLVMMKMEASRGRDLSDLYILLGWADDRALDEVRKAVKRYMPEDMDDLESIIYIGRQEQESGRGNA